MRASLGMNLEIDHNRHPEDRPLMPARSIVAWFATPAIHAALRVTGRQDLEMRIEGRQNVIFAHALEQPQAEQEGVLVVFNGAAASREDTEPLLEIYISDRPGEKWRHECRLYEGHPDYPGGPFLECRSRRHQSGERVRGAAMFEGTAPQASFTMPEALEAGVGPVSGQVSHFSSKHADQYLRLLERTKRSERRGWLHRGEKLADLSSLWAAASLVFDADVPTHELSSKGVPESFKLGLAAAWELLNAATPRPGELGLHYPGYLRDCRTREILASVSRVEYGSDGPIGFSLALEALRLRYLFEPMNLHIMDHAYMAGAEAGASLVIGADERIDSDDKEARIIQVEADALRLRYPEITGRLISPAGEEVKPDKRVVEDVRLRLKHRWDYWMVHW